MSIILTLIQQLINETLKILKPSPTTPKPAPKFYQPYQINPSAKPIPPTFSPDSHKASKTSAPPNFPSAKRSPLSTATPPSASSCPSFSPYSSSSTTTGTIFFTRVFTNTYKSSDKACCSCMWLTLRGLSRSS
jgi:hypothetical protein